jgi:SsrA-binding protein
MNKKAPQANRTIALNKKSQHDYLLEDRFEAGVVLQGWEVKSIRAGRIQIKESYVILKQGEAFLLGAHISPLTSASTHIDPDPTRTRKLLLHQRELSKLIGAVNRQGYAIVPVAMYWKKNHIKLEIALAKGKKAFDKRASEKDRDWQRQKAHMMKKQSH